MKKSFKLSAQTTVDYYLYSEQFEKREFFRSNETATIANMRYMPLLNFDLGSLAGKKISGGTLTIKITTPDYPLEVEITTITQDWDEAAANYYQCRNGQGWAGEKWLSDVMMSEGNSRYFREKTRFDPETGLMQIDIPAYVLYAVANGQSFGFGMIDCKSRGYGSKPGEGWNVLKKFNVNETNGPAPVLEVEYGEAFNSIPKRVENLSGLGLENSESLKYADAVLNWSLNEDLCECSAEYRFFNIYFSEKETDICSMEHLPRYFIPEYNTEAISVGTEIGNLKPETTYNFAVTVSNGINESEPVYTKVKTLGLRELPDASGVRASASCCGEAPEACCCSTANACCEAASDECCNDVSLGGKDFRVYILDEIAKVDPVGGYINEGNKESDQDCCCQKSTMVGDYNSCLFDGCKVALVGAPGEKLAFQIVVENLTSKAAGFSASIVRSKGLDIEVGRVWYLKNGETWYPEVVVPMAGDGSFSIPYVENKIDGQKYQAVEIDIDIPEVLKEGRYSFNLIIGTAAEKVNVPVEMQVVPVKLERSKFILELNGYVCLSDCAGIDRSDPDYWKVEEEYYRTAHKHHMSINILPYTHFGTVQEGFSPKIEFIDGLPRVTDWSSWDAHFAKYLDGSYLLETEGKRVPITHIYLPFHENWPMPINEYYKVKVDRGPEDYPENINEHKLKANSPYVDFMPEYREGIKAVMKDFINHIEEKGWKDVQFQYFFNNKHFYKQKGFVDRCGDRKGLEMWLTKQTCGNDGLGTSWWLLDEPHFRDDWEAIHYMGSILKEAQNELNAGYNIKFRADLSCYNQMFNFLDGVLDTAIIGGRAYNEREDVTRKRNEKFGEENWTYGSWNSVDQPNMNSFLWILEAYLKGGSGLVPWYNFGLDYNYEYPDSCAGLYPGTRFGTKKPMVSLRLKSGRKALEIARYLTALKKAFGYSGLQLKAYVSAFLNLKGEAVIRHRDDAGFVKYEGKNDYAAIEALKKDIIAKLMVRQGRA